MHERFEKRIEEGLESLTAMAQRCSMTAVQIVDVVLPTRYGRQIHKRYVGKPTEHQAILLHKLRLSLPRSLEAIGV